MIAANLTIIQKTRSNLLIFFQLLCSLHISLKRKIEMKKLNARRFSPYDSCREDVDFMICVRQTFGNEKEVFSFSNFNISETCVNTKT